MASGTFPAGENTTYATAPIGAVFNDGDYWTFTDRTVIPEPGSIAGVLAGLVGLVAARRRTTG